MDTETVKFKSAEEIKSDLNAKWIEQLPDLTESLKKRLNGEIESAMSRGYSGVEIPPIGEGLEDIAREFVEKAGYKFKVVTSWFSQQKTAVIITWDSVSSKGVMRYQRGSF